MIQISKIDISNPDDFHRTILNILNHGSNEAIEWGQSNFTKRQIKETIKKSYASEWFKWRLEKWSDFYKAYPKWQTRIEYILSREIEQ